MMKVKPVKAGDFSDVVHDAGGASAGDRSEGKDELLKPEQAAALLKVPVSFIYERTRLNSIPVKRVGKYVRIPKAELLAWVDAQSPA